MPNKRRGRPPPATMRATEPGAAPFEKAKEEKVEEEEEQDLHWLTFQNGDCLSEEQVGSEPGAFVL